MFDYFKIEPGQDVIKQNDALENITLQILINKTFVGAPDPFLVISSGEQ
jgi:hypothetical protein